MFVTGHSSSLLFSSDPALGATNLSGNGAAFEVSFSEPLAIPRQALNVEVMLAEATVWWTVANIEEGKNDKLYIDDTLAPASYVVTIPQGLYDRSGLNAAVQRDLANQGAPANLLIINQDAPTGKVVLQFGVTGTTVDFTQPDTPRIILGFNSQVVGPSPAPPPGGVISVLAPNVAEFNQINSFLIHSDIVSRGVQLNNGYSQILGQVLINVPPGSQIVSSPFNPPRVAADELRGQDRRTVRMWLTDEKNQLVNTAGEYWTARVTVSYQLPHVSNLEH